MTISWRKQRSFDAFFKLTLCISMIFVLAGCTSTTVGTQGKPVPDMTFAHVEPLLLKVSSIDIVNNYDPSEDAEDMSNALPTPPDIALRRYAESKFKADDFQDTLKFVIEEVYTHVDEQPPVTGLMAWSKPSAKDTYKVVMKVRMYTQNDLGEQSEHSILTFKRSIAIPHSYSVAEREFEQYKFLETLMDDVDNVVTKTLHEKMGLTVVTPVYREVQ